MRTELSGMDICPDTLPLYGKDPASPAVASFKSSSRPVDATALPGHHSLNGSVKQNMTISSWILGKFSYFAASFEAYNTLDLWLPIRKK